MDRHGNPLSATPQCPSALALLVEEYCCQDLWRSLNLHMQAYLWAIPGRGSLSRIDLSLGSDKTVTKVTIIFYLTRGILNHSPLFLTLKIGNPGKHSLVGILGNRTDKVGLYSYYLILYLNDAQDSICAGMHTMETFGSYSGFKINWQKSALMTIHPHTHTSTYTPFRNYAESS